MVDLRRGEIDRPGFRLWLAPPNQFAAFQSIQAIAELLNCQGDFQRDVGVILLPAAWRFGQFLPHDRRRFVTQLSRYEHLAANDDGNLPEADDTVDRA